MKNCDTWCVIENAGYIDEAHVGSFDTFKEAQSYVVENYTKEEVEALHVEITCNGSYEH